MNKRVLALASVAAVGLGAAAQATTIYYPDFSDTAGLTLNGNAAKAGSSLRVTPANYSQSGSAWSTTTIALNNLSSFSTYFEFRITESGGSTDVDGWGADGIVFAVQTMANNVGGGGGGIGFDGIAHSVGIEFDTWNNGYQDAYSGNHVGVDLNGSMTSHALATVGTRMNNGGIWYSWIDYNGTSQLLEVRLSDTPTRPTSAILNDTVDLSSVLGSPDAFVGFTSGTGAAFGNHDILTWQFESDYKPIIHPGVPEAGSVLIMLAMGCFGMGIFSRFSASRRQ